jgi:hypothetical protein
MRAQWQQWVVPQKVLRSRCYAGLWHQGYFDLLSADDRESLLRRDSIFIRGGEAPPHGRCYESVITPPSTLRLSRPLLQVMHRRQSSTSLARAQYRLLREFSEGMTIFIHHPLGRAGLPRMAFRRIEAREQVTGDVCREAESDRPPLRCGNQQTFVQ